MSGGVYDGTGCGVGIGLLFAVVIFMTIILPGMVKTAEERARYQDISERLELQLAQPDPHAVEIVRTDDGELIVLPKGTSKAEGK